MAYDEALAQRILNNLREQPGITQRRMFGGIAFMRDGHMFVGISDDSLMARVGPNQYEQILGMKHVRKMVFTGRPIRGYVFVDRAGVKSEQQLMEWLQRCAAFVGTLPAKSPG
ncbi:MAG: TfoX/Sxy family protein [Lautropia sp.]